MKGFPQRTRICWYSSCCSKLFCKKVFWDISQNSQENTSATSRKHLQWLLLLTSMFMIYILGLVMNLEREGILCATLSKTTKFVTRKSYLEVVWTAWEPCCVLFELNFRIRPDLFSWNGLKITYCYKIPFFFHSFLRIWSHLLKKSLMENFIFYALPCID